MRITVRRSHINSAHRKDSHHCMIADAIKDHLGAQFIVVDTQAIRFSDPASKERYVYLTPPSAQNAILRWDRGIDVQPFAFELHDPVRVMPVRRVWTGNPATLKKVRARYAARRKTAALRAAAPRLVKKRSATVSRFREFGLRRFTK